MKLSYNFLQTFFKEKLPDPFELANFMTLNIAENEQVVYFGGKYRDVEIVQVLKIENHPNAEKLVLLQVAKTGLEETFQVVTGAKNLKAGDKIALVEKGGFIPGGFGSPGFTVEARDMRGVISERVSLSAKELGIGTDHTGIFVFPEDTKLGKLLESLPYFDDYTIEIDNKALSNRSDMFSHIGVAREIAAFLGLKMIFELPEVELKKSPENLFENIDSVVQKYTISKFSFEERPSDLRTAEILACSGIRPISRLVDATNFAMIVTGQPFHVFDSEKLQKIAGQSLKIGVRKSKQNEKFTTLDSAERSLLESDLLITVSGNPVGLAGVMGGLNSESENSTKEVLIEAAVFPQNLIRKTARRLGLLSEAAQRFEHGVDPNFTDLAQKFLLNHLGVKSFEYFDYSNFKEGEKKTLLLPSKFAGNIIGHEINLEFQIECLKKLGCDISIEEKSIRVKDPEFLTNFDPTTIIVSIPTWRTDLNIPEDLVEEIGRMDSLTKIEERPIVGESKPSKKEHLMDLELLLRDSMVGMGFAEVYTFSFLLDTKYSDMFSIPAESLIEVTNAPSKKMCYLRPLISANLLEVAEDNRGYFDQQMVFEIGKVFEKPSSKANLPIDEEKEKKSFGFYILSKDNHQKIVRQINGVLKKLSQNFGANYDTLRKVAITKVFNDSDLKLRGSNLVTCEISLLDFENAKENQKRFKDLPKYPIVLRDVNFELEKSKKTVDLKKAIRSKLDLLPKKDFTINFQLVDLFETNEFKRFTVRFSFESLERTLESREIDEVLEKVK